MGTQFRHWKTNVQTENIDNIKSSHVLESRFGTISFFAWASYELAGTREFNSMFQQSGFKPPDV